MSCPERLGVECDSPGDDTCNLASCGGGIWQNWSLLLRGHSSSLHGRTELNSLNKYGSQGFNPAWAPTVRKAAAAAARSSGRLPPCPREAPRASSSRCSSCTGQGSPQRNLTQGSVTRGLKPHPTLLPLRKRKHQPVAGTLLGMARGCGWLTATTVPWCHALTGLVPLLSHCSRMGWEAGFSKES